MATTHVSVTNTLRLYIGQSGKCKYCGCDIAELIKDEKPIHVDHIVSRKNGGTNQLDNLCLSCGWCNVVKNSKTLEQFMAYIQPYLDGKIKKEDLREYHIYRKLKERFDST